MWHVAHDGAGFWQEPGDDVGMKFMENCSQQQGFILEQFAKDYSPWDRLRAGAGEEYEEEEAAETTCNKLAMNPILCPRVLLDGKEVKKIVSEVKHEKKGGVGGKCFEICFYFPSSCSDL